MKQDKFTGSEGDSTNKVECTSEGILDPEECNKLWYARSSMQMRDRVLLRLIGET